MNAPCTIRSAEQDDLPAVSDLLERCGWRDQNRLETLSYIAQSRDGQITVAESDRSVVGVVGALRFAGTGWVTTLVVEPGTRGRGLAARLSETSMAWLRQGGSRTVHCLITPQARRLAENMEFVEEGELTMGWMPALDGEPAAGEGGSKGTRALRPEDLEQLRVLDREATGEDRSSFLRAAADQGGVAIDGEEGELDGFDLYCRWGPGPTVARTPEAGLELIETRRRRWRGPRAIILPTSNDAVLAGLPEARWFMRLTRMRWGPAVAWRPEMQFGVCNFYWG